MSMYTVRLFGRFSARRGDEDVQGLDSLKAQELLAYMLLHRDRAHTRDALCAALWTEAIATQARKALRQALWQVQSALGGSSEAADASLRRLLVADPVWVAVQPDADVWVDALAVRGAAAVVAGIKGQDIGPAAFIQVDEAVGQYAGELLEGCYEEWCLSERERFEITWLALLDKLMGYCEAHGNYEAGLAYGERILERDRARERTYRQLMRLHYLAGDRTGALRQYRRCLAALSEELGVRPDRRTLALLEQIRADQLDAVAPASPAQAGQGEVHAELITRFRQLRATLSQVQAELSRDISLLEHVTADRR